MKLDRIWHFDTGSSKIIVYCEVGLKNIVSWLKVFVFKNLVLETNISLLKLCRNKTMYMLLFQFLYRNM